MILKVGQRNYDVEGWREKDGEGWMDKEGYRRQEGMWELDQRRESLKINQVLQIRMKII